MNRASNSGIAYRLALAVVVLDQLSKAWVRSQLQEGQVQPLLPGLVQQRLVFNTGAAFSLLTGKAWLLGLVSAGVAVALVLWIQRGGPWHRLQALGLGLLLGGAIGNGVDRWRLGTVVDFLEIVPIRFPVFNVADVAINLAVAALVIDWWRQQSSRAE
jgi:signal peptidase II